MKWINEKGKLFGIINPVDLMVLVFILLVAGAVSWKIFGGQVTRIVTPVEELTYTVRIKNAESQYYDMLISNEFPQQLTAGEGYVKDAFLVSAEKVPAIVYVYTEDGRVLAVEDPSKVDILCTIQAKTENTAILKVGTQEVRAGKDHYVKTKYCELLGRIEQVSFGE